MPKIRLSLSVGDEHLADLAGIAGAARKAGMDVEHQHASLGIVTGSIEAGKLDALRRIPGVAAIEEERQVGVAPPGSDLQ
jgi:hypothetical protein